MNFNEEDIRSDVGFVCIGQAAGNIGLLFEEKESMSGLPIEW